MKKVQCLKGRNYVLPIIHNYNVFENLRVENSWNFCRNVPGSPSTVYIIEDSVNFHPFPFDITRVKRFDKKNMKIYTLKMLIISFGVCGADCNHGAGILKGYQAG